MTKRGKGSRGGKPQNRKLDKKNTRRQSNPSSKEGKIQAIKQDLEATVRGYLPQMIMESELRQRDMAEVMGVGGPSLNLYIDEFESGYSGATGEPSTKPYGLDKEERPDLSLESRDATMPWGAADDANFGGKPDKSSSKKPKRKPRGKK